MMMLIISGFVEGYDLGVATIGNLYIQDRYFVSLAPLGAALGALVAGPFVDRWGRRPVVFASDVLYVLGGAFITMFKLHYGLIYLGRFVVGLAIGVTSMVVPIYITEVVPNELRGRFVAWYTFMVVLGQFTANVVSLLMTDKLVMIYWVGGIFVAIQMAGLIFLVPESPRWLAKKSKEDEAEKILEKIYKPEYV